MAGFLLDPSRPFISDPYNFKHLTHTGPVQARALQTNDRNQLINEFSVMRASQAPKPQLQGIKADDIIADDTYTPSVSRSPSPPQSNRHVTNQRTLRSIRSMDSFTRVASNSFSSPHPPISPPSRRSSRQQHQRISQGLGLNNFEASLVSDVPTSRHSPKSSLAPVEEVWTSSQEIAQAFTTPDDSAQLIFTHQRTISSNNALAEVPEEDDEAVRLEKTEARIRELRRVKELRHAKSLPAQIALISEFPTPCVGEEEDIPARSSRQISSDVVQANWEEDIDYCYQHAMEAIGYAWDEEESPENYDCTPSTNPYSGSYFISSRQGNRGSATSSSLSVPGIATPSDTFPTRDSNSTSHSLLFPLSPSATSKEFNLHSPSEEQYQHRMMDSYSPVDISSGDSGSGSGTSKRSSRESQTKRTALGVAAGSASSRHRSMNSIDSVPDLSLYGLSKRLTSTSILSQDLPSSTAPPVPALASRSRAASESTSKLLDLAMIGAPAPFGGNRTRAGSMASNRARQSGMTTAGRPSYNLFPSASPVVPSLR